MKTTESKTTTQVQTKKEDSRPFFSQEGQDGVFVSETPFFSAGESSGAHFFNPSLGAGGLPKATPSPHIQTKLTIGAPNDPYEQEADAMAEKVVQRLAEQPSSDNQQATGDLLSQPSAVNRQPLAVQRKCAECEQEEKIQEKEDLSTSSDELQRKPIFDSNDEPPDDQGIPVGGGIQRKCAACGKEMEDIGSGIQRKPSGEMTASPDVASRLSASKGAGSPLPDSTRSSMESAFGADFSGVRIHTGSEAVQMSRDLSAQAFTHGSDVYFGAGKYEPGTKGGDRLLAHELTHVGQQGGAAIQRTTHGSGTPTNCHNWTIPLPPWTAGTIAHGQIPAFLGLHPSLIPRATKVLMGLQNPPLFTPPGYADLWRNDMTSVNVAEIKSTATGSAVAQNEARHYRNRHDEWFTRSLKHPLAIDDATYLAMVGSSKPGSLLNLSAVTGTDMSLGPFWGDPLKQLHIEADNFGAVVYWCTGTGLIGSPAWYPVFRAIIEELKRRLEEAKRILEQIGEALGGALAWIKENAVPIFVVLMIIAIIACLVLAIVCLILAPETAGLTLACSYLSLEGMVSAFAALLLVFGISSEGLPESTANLYGALHPEKANKETIAGSDYERDTGNGNYPKSTGNAKSAVTAINPSSDFLAALQPIVGQVLDPVGLYQTLSANFSSVPPNGLTALNKAITVLEQNGDSSTVGFISRMMQENNIGSTGKG